jgi:hypothetical protein
MDLVELLIAELLSGVLGAEPAENHLLLASILLAASRLLAQLFNCFGSVFIASVVKAEPTNGRLQLALRVLLATQSFSSQLVHLIISKFCASMRYAHVFDHCVLAATFSLASPSRSMLAAKSISHLVGLAGNALVVHMLTDSATGPTRFLLLYYI